MLTRSLMGQVGALIVTVLVVGLTVSGCETTTPAITQSPTPPTTVVVAPAQGSSAVVAPSAPTVVRSQPLMVVPEQPPIDASGIVASYDRQTGTLTFQDGRVVRLTSASGAWGPASAAVLQPGAQVHVHNVQPVGYQPVGVQPTATSWRMGTVSAVDQANGLIYLYDGSVVRVAPSAMILGGQQRIALTQVQPGSQIAIGTTGAATTVSPPTVTTVTPGVYSSALPRQTVVPLESQEIRIFVVQ